MCRTYNAVQRIPENGVLIDFEWPARKRADPDLLRFFEVGCDRLRSRVAPEADALSN
jgi:hypothetical protein